MQRRRRDVAEIDKRLATPTRRRRYGDGAGARVAAAPRGAVQLGGRHVAQRVETVDPADGELGDVTLARAEVGTANGERRAAGGGALSRRHARDLRRAAAGRQIAEAAGVTPASEHVVDVVVVVGGRRRAVVVVGEDATGVVGGVRQVVTGARLRRRPVTDEEVHAVR